MGLDWNPGPKAKSGCEQEFRELWQKLHAKLCWSRATKLRRFKEITVTAFETLATPRVGFDSAATDWAREKAFPRRADKSLTEATFVEGMKGFYVLELLPPCDGLPRYSNGEPGGYVEPYAFRGQFLKDCTEIIGKELLDSAWNSRLPEETLQYGNALLERANESAKAKGIDIAKCALPDDPDSIEFHIDVVAAAGRWCRFWGERGHWLDAYS
jgi:hypothetical protein